MNTNGIYGIFIHIRLWNYKQHMLANVTYSILCYYCSFTITYTVKDTCVKLGSSDFPPASLRYNQHVVQV